MTPKKSFKPKLGTVDPSSYSNPDQVKVENIELFWDISFEKQTLNGKVHLTCKKVTNAPPPACTCEEGDILVLDVRDINVKNVTNLSNQEALKFEVGEPYFTFGSYLKIVLPNATGDGGSYKICIEYETSSKASALQWLSPEQTLGKQEPFMFSQCQSIHCRSIIPCQDTPYVKCPYKAEVTAPKQLMVLMSAIKTEEPVVVGDKNKWSFSQNIPIPSYLIAIASGRLKGKLLGLKSMVYAEPEIVQECVFEFSETDKMLKAASDICGEYVWGRYDLLVLPPSFPYGGMENPCLTFVTPTLLAGDRSLTCKILKLILQTWYGNIVTASGYQHVWLNVTLACYMARKIGKRFYGENYRDFESIAGLMNLERTAGDRSLASVIAHEIAHSWTGNLVTNKTFEHFWLNEGFTTFIERKIQGLMFGEAHRHFHAFLGLSTLRDTIIKTLGEGNPYTCLVPCLKNVDPDDAFSAVPYEKGHTFLFYLEQLIDDPAEFSEFLKSYLQKFKFQSITTDDFKQYLYDFFRDKKEKLDGVDWNRWFYCPGMPPVVPEYDKTLIADVEKLVEKWIGWNTKDDCVFFQDRFSYADIEQFTSAQKCLLLARLWEAEPFDVPKLKAMEQTYRFVDIKNAEIKFRWLRLCIRGEWKEKIPEALKFVNEQGRMKFVRPIYRDLFVWEDAKAVTQMNFIENKKYMMYVCASQVEKDLGLNLM